MVMYKFTFMRNKVEIMKKKSHKYPFFLTLRQKLASIQKLNIKWKISSWRQWVRTKTSLLNLLEYIKQAICALRHKKHIRFVPYFPKKTSSLPPGPLTAQAIHVL